MSPPAPHTVSLTRNQTSQSDRQASVAGKPKAANGAPSDGVALSMVISKFLEERDAERYAATPALTREDSLDPIIFSREYTNAGGVKVKAIFEFDPSHPGLDSLAARALMGSKEGQTKSDGRANVLGGCLTVRVRRK